MTGSLHDQAESFAGRLTALITATIDPTIEFHLVQVNDHILRIGPGPFDNATDRDEAAGDSGFAHIRLVRECDEAARLFLRTHFTVALDREQEHLAVLRSAFSLWVRPDPRGPRARPVVRVEYDREAKTKPAAHVHIHAESAEIGWIYGTAGEPLSRPEDVHFPVGGRRFRPSLEDFLLFLDRERLFTNWLSDDWESLTLNSLGEYEERQARSTARRFPDAAVQQLQSMGYDVTKPDSL